jgi:transposase InsO family protein
MAHQNEGKYDDIALLMYNYIQNAINQQGQEEHREARRLEAERLEDEILESERREAEQREAERREAGRREAERREAERLEARRLEYRRLEARRREAERLEAQQRETERREAEALQRALAEIEEYETQKLIEEVEAINIAVESFERRHSHQRNSSLSVEDVEDIEDVEDGYFLENPRPPLGVAPAAHSF